MLHRFGPLDMLHLTQALDTASTIGDLSRNLGPFLFILLQLTKVKALLTDGTLNASQK